MKSIAATLAVLLAAAPALAAPPAREVQVAALMERLKTDPPALRVFLTEMPKGGDLHSFLPGASLWRPDGERVAACAAAGAACDAFLKGGEKAQAQWRLEQDVARFEAEALDGGHLDRQQTRELYIKSP